MEKAVISRFTLRKLLNLVKGGWVDCGRGKVELNEDSHAASACLLLKLGVESDVEMGHTRISKIDSMVPELFMKISS